MRTPGHFRPFPGPSPNKPSRRTERGRLDIGPSVADKGYDSAANRQLARNRGSLTVIPYRKNTRNRPKRFAKALYRERARIEQAVGKLNRFKRIALRYEKTATNFSSFVALATAFILIKSVHRT